MKETFRCEKLFESVFLLFLEKMLVKNSKYQIFSTFLGTVSEKKGKRSICGSGKEGTTVPRQFYHTH